MDKWVGIKGKFKIDFGFRLCLHACIASCCTDDEHFFYFMYTRICSVHCTATRLSAFYICCDSSWLYIRCYTYRNALGQHCSYCAHICWIFRYILCREYAKICPSPPTARYIAMQYARHHCRDANATFWGWKGHWLKFEHCKTGRGMNRASYAVFKRTKCI